MIVRGQMTQQKGGVTRGQMLRLENAIRTSLEPYDAEANTQHHFAPGIYLRSLFLPAGTVLTGKIHRFETMNILMFGTIRVATEGGVTDLTGPLVFNSPPGTKKAGFAMTDCLFCNVHPTDLTDLEKIEAEFIVPSFEALDQESTPALNQETES